jgi:hypothetical protein
MVVPRNFKKAIDNNTVYDLSLDCNVDGKVLMGKVSTHGKVITPLGP